MKLKTLNNYQRFRLVMVLTKAVNSSKLFFDGLSGAESFLISW